MRRDEALFQAANVSVVLVGLGEPAEARAFRARLGLPYPVLCDPRQRAYRAYGLLRASAAAERHLSTLVRGVADLARHGGALSPHQDMLQLGGAFVVDRDGLLRYIYQAERVSAYPPTADLLHAASGA